MQVVEKNHRGSCYKGPFWRALEAVWEASFACFGLQNEMKNNMYFSTNFLCLLGCVPEGGGATRGKNVQRRGREGKEVK